VNQNQARPAASLQWPAAELVTLTDEEVVDRVRGGDAALFEVLMRRYNERLYRTARAVLGTDEEAEDVVQQSYVSAFQHLAQFAGRARFSTWLTRIVLNEAYARARRRGRLVQAPWDASEEERFVAEPSSPGPSPEVAAAHGELRGLLETAIETLPMHYRVVFVMRSVELMNTADTAACLDLSEEAVKTRLHRAHGLLRRTLCEAIGTESPDVFRFYRPRCDRLVAAVMDTLRTQ
jgi:RNA polymerase sigma-70 factor (ECF subfamily)